MAATMTAMMGVTAAQAQTAASDFRSWATDAPMG